MRTLFMAFGALVDGLKRHTLRTLLTLFGLALGSGSIVVLGWLVASAGDALGRFTLEATGAHVLTVHEGAFDPWTRLRKERWLGEADAQALAEHPGLALASATAQRVRYGTHATAQGRSLTVTVASGGSEFAELSSYTMAHGRWALPAEASTRVCVIGSDLMEQLYPQGWPAAAPLVLDGTVSCRVVGALAPRPAQSIEGIDASSHPNRHVFMPTAAFARAFGEAGTMTLHIDPGPAERSARAGAVEQLLVGLHHGAHNFQVDEAVSNDQVQRLIVVAIEALLVCGALIATAVGGINVMNAQMVSVAERTREYGLARALGLSRRTLQRVVLVESALLASLGGVLGSATGLLVAVVGRAILVSMTGPWPFVLPAWSIPLALASSLVAGTLAGVFPARRAAWLEPSTCLAEA